MEMSHMFMHGNCIKLFGARIAYPYKSLKVNNPKKLLQT